MWFLPRATLAVAISTFTPALGAESVTGDLAFAKGDYTIAFSEWSAAATAGDASAMSGLGTLYDTGHGVSQDFPKALLWYQRAAEAGDIPAMFSTAAMYDNGRGTSINRAQAVHWYDLAAQKGSGRAAYNLGVIYRDGDGVPRDKALAIRFFSMASAAGIEAARPNLAVFGVSVAPRLPTSTHFLAPVPLMPPTRTDDMTAEIDRFQKAALGRKELQALSPKTFNKLVSALNREAHNSDSLAEYDLGFAYEHGYGTPVDLTKSYVYYLKAATSHDNVVNAAALQGATEVGKQLSPQQHADARDILLSGL